MFEVIKSGKTNTSVWLYGTCDLEIMSITGIFNCNLKELPTSNKLKIKKVKISSSKKTNKTIYYIEF